ncbi:GNAT family N-acetyltransferase [Serinicoccus kebangsaanensis]|uniref:GNAT family N-acetyltransferase n=1 Tax=Serinicoccus kebangsaanensis TaxID=2602069 RepID=UPI00124E334B|nr:GNAT family N-acetyltransferase [Serinicoccus kebangsaanensis]
MDIIISDCAAGDHAAVLALADRLTEGTAPWRDADAVARTVREWVREALAGAEPGSAPVWVAREQDRVVGFVHAGTRTHWSGEVDAYISELVVAETHTGAGIGRRLVARAEDWAREHGHTRVTLETGQHNERARALYAQLGYVTEEVVLTREL